MNILFPKSFRFGVADADLQVVGEDFTYEEGSTQSMWNHYARFSGKVHMNEPPGKGIDKYHKWPEDVEQMKQLGIKHFRTSVSMTRILQPDGHINTKALQWYKKYFSALNKSGILVYATIYHWELPQYLSEQGGWKNRKVLDPIVKHAETVVNELGEYIEEYFLFNEPRHVTFRSYHEGVQAPGEKNLQDGILATHHILLAHGLVTEAMLAINKHLKISTVLNMSPCYAASSNEKDLKAVAIADACRNGWFGDPLYLGKYPDIVMKLFEGSMKAFSDTDMKIIKVGKRLHAMGINYYKGVLVQHDEKEDLQYKLVHPHQAQTNALGWPTFQPPELPEALYDVFKGTYDTYKNAGLKELYVAENGFALATPWDKKASVIEDMARITYLKEHLRQTHKAILAGVPISMYLLWTLQDNWEWTYGYKPEAQFGIIHVDRKTMQRIPKESAYWYKDLIKSHSFSY